MKNLDQIRAANAMEAAKKKMGAKEKGEVVKKVPTMIRDNGILGALAFAREAGEGYVDCFSSYVEYDYITEKEYSHYVTITECMGCKDVDVVSLSKHGTCLKYPKEKR